MCREILESPEDAILDSLRDVRNLERASQVAIRHIHQMHPEQWVKANTFTANVLKFHLLSTLIPTEADAPMFVSGMEKLRVGLGALFVPEPIEKSDPTPVLAHLDNA